MIRRNKLAACLAACTAAYIAWLPSAALAQSAAEAQAAAQHEADLRVIAARCGTPAFERAFVKQSRNYVGAGLLVRNREPSEVEKSITNLRRSPMLLVASTSDCPAQLEQLAQLQKERSQLIRPGRKSAAK